MTLSSSWRHVLEFIEWGEEEVRIKSPDRPASRGGGGACHSGLFGGSHPGSGGGYASKDNEDYNTLDDNTFQNEHKHEQRQHDEEGFHNESMMMAMASRCFCI